MKRIISIVLALLMTLSCLGTLTVFAETTEEEESTTKSIYESLNELVGIDFSNALSNPDLSSLFQDDKSFEELMAEGYFKDKTFMGLSIDYMYNSDTALFWSKVGISRSDLALIYGNLNAYLLKIKKAHLTGYGFYTGENASRICNLIGNLYDPQFGNDIKISFDSEPTTSEIFYETICERSGLTDWIDRQWIRTPKKTYYVAMCTTLGMKLNDLPAPERDILIASKVAPLLVKSIVEYKSTGPFNRIIETARTFFLTYNYYLSNAVIPFFQKYIDANYTTEAQLKTFKGLLNQIFNSNGFHANFVDKIGDQEILTPKMQFIAPPARRIASTEDEVENFLYLIVYCNMLGVYGTNGQTVARMKRLVQASPLLDDVQKQRVLAIIGMLFEGRIAEVEPELSAISMEIISAVPNNLKNMLFGFAGRFVDAFFSFFDKIYQAIRNLL